MTIVTGQLKLDSIGPDHRRSSGLPVTIALLLARHNAKRSNHLMRNAEIIAARSAGKKSVPRNGRGRIAKGTLNSAQPVPPLDDPALYVNRELSLLDFQRRVLEEAQDATVPLLERVKFLSIVGSNLDEFFMVRVAGLKRQVERGVLECGPDGMTPQAQLAAIRERVTSLFRDAHECWHQQVLPSLAKAGIQIADYSQLNTR